MCKNRKLYTEQYLTGYWFSRLKANWKKNLRKGLNKDKGVIDGKGKFVVKLYIFNDKKLELFVYGDGRVDGNH